MYCVGFFFKQKTAYEMRISDWSSDVCSSDLPQLFCKFSTGLPVVVVGGAWFRRIGELYVDVVGKGSIFGHESTSAHEQPVEIVHGQLHPCRPAARKRVV